MGLWEEVAAAIYEEHERGMPAFTRTGWKGASISAQAVYMNLAAAALSVIRREQAMQALADQAQQLDLGY